MRRKTLIMVVVLVAVAFVAWKMWGSQIRKDVQGIVSFVGPTTVTPVPGTAQPTSGGQALQSADTSTSNLATLFPPDIFGPDSLGGLDL